MERELTCTYGQVDCYLWYLPTYIDSKEVDGEYVLTQERDKKWDTMMKDLVPLICGRLPVLTGYICMYLCTPPTDPRRRSTPTPDPCPETRRRLPSRRCTWSVADSYLSSPFSHLDLRRHLRVPHLFVFNLRDSCLLLNRHRTAASARFASPSSIRISWIGTKGVGSASAAKKPISSVSSGVVISPDSTASA